MERQGHQDDEARPDGTVRAASARLVRSWLGARVFLLSVGFLALLAVLVVASIGSGSVRAGPGGTDTDADGCTDTQELGGDPLLGGQRNPNSFWDFFDTPDSSNVRDRAIVVADIFRVSQRLGTSGSATSVANARSAPPASGYHAAFDRSAPAVGADLWDSGPADGAIATGDIAFAVAQFGHSCSGAAGPTPTSTPSGPTPTPLPPGSSWTITFDDLSGQDRTLNGAYPGGVVDWGLTNWWLSGPYGRLTSKSVGFNGPGLMSATFTFITPRHLFRIDAYNGGVDAIVTLSCPGQPDRVASLANTELATIATNWPGTCTSVTIASTNGWNTNFDNFVVDGPRPTPTPTPTPLPPIPTPTPGPPGFWAFEETFDGAPSSPLPFSSPRWDVIGGGNDDNGVMNGQTILSVDPLVMDYSTLEMGHGPDCGAPIGRGDLNNHIVTADWDVQGHQVNTRPQLVYTCNNHVMTMAKAGYGLVSMQPRQLFDWQGRMGTMVIDTNVYGFGREWWDLYIVPEDEMLLDIQAPDEGGGQEGLPKRGVRFSFLTNTPQVAVFDDYQQVYTWRNWQGFAGAFPDDPALTDPRIRRQFRFRLSQAGWSYEIQKADGTWWSHSGTFDQPLSFTRGLVRMEHHSYNPTKDGIFGAPWSQFTYHWDNFRFDGPVVPARKSYEAGLKFVDMKYAAVGTISEPVTINVGSTTNPHLIGHLSTQMFSSSDTNDLSGHILNLEHWVQVRVNNGPWRDVQFRKNVPCCSGRGWSTIDTPLTGVVQGQNTIQFKYNARPSGLTWQSAGFRIKDLSIDVDERGFATAAPGSQVLDEAMVFAGAYCDVTAAHVPLALGPPAAADLGRRASVRGSSVPWVTG